MPHYRYLDREQEVIRILGGAAPYELAQRAVKEAARELGIPVPSISWFVPASADAAGSFYSPHSLNGRFFGKRPNMIEIHARGDVDGPDGVCTFLAHECRHVKQWSDEGWKTGLFLPSREEECEAVCYQFQHDFYQRFFNRKLSKPAPSPLHRRSTRAVGDLIADLERLRARCE